MKKILNEFKEFISKGNVIDLAVGMIIGSAFTAIVSSLSSSRHSVLTACRKLTSKLLNVRAAHRI